MNIFKSFKAQMLNHRNVEDVFTPSSPIKDPENLKGRDDEIKTILQTIISKGRHGLIFGDRGIGKSSLALSSLNGAVKEKIYNGKIIKVECGVDSTFDSIIKKPLTELDPDYASNKLEETTKTSGTLGVPKVLSGERIVETKKTIAQKSSYKKINKYFHKRTQQYSTKDPSTATRNINTINVSQIRDRVVEASSKKIRENK